METVTIQAQHRAAVETAARINCTSDTFGIYVYGFQGFKVYSITLRYIGTIEQKWGSFHGAFKTVLEF